MLQLPPQLQSVDIELNRQFRQAAMASSADSDSFFNNISIRFATLSPSDQVLAMRCAVFFEECLCLHKQVLQVAPEHKYGMQATSLHAAKQALHVPSLDHWDALCLDYKLKWPLHILLTPEVGHTLFQHPSSYL